MLLDLLLDLPEIGVLGKRKEVNSGVYSQGIYVRILTLSVRVVLIFTEEVTSRQIE